MYTTHGHQIVGTTAEKSRPSRVARCGGPRLCKQCALEVIAAMTDLVKSTKHFVKDKHEQLAELKVQYQKMHDDIVELEWQIAMEEEPVVNRISGNDTVEIIKNIRDGL